MSNKSTAEPQTLADPHPETFPSHITKNITSLCPLCSLWLIPFLDTPPL